VHKLKSHQTVENIAKKHRMDVSFVRNQLRMGIAIEKEHTKDKDLATDIALQHLDEFPDYYTKLKKMESDAKKEHKKFKDVKITEEGLRDWYRSKSKDGKPGWVNVVTGGTCASDEPGEGVPKCVSSAKRESMTKAQRLSAARRKKAADPAQQEKSGAAKPTYVSTDKQENKMNEEKDIKGKGSGKKDACYTKVKSRYDVWPSAYASGALVKCRKVGAANWGNKSESVNLSSNDPLSEQMGMVRYCPKCEKDETREECRYGPKYWDMFSVPSSLSPNQLKYNTTRPHPANESKETDHEYSMARSEISTIISAAKRLRNKLKGEGNIEAWVQSKITKAADYIDAAADYLESGEHDVVDEACWVGYKQVGMKKKGKKMVPNCVKESVSIEDSNGNHYAQFIDIIKPEPLKATKGIGSRMLGEGPSFDVGSNKLSSAQEKLQRMSPSQRSQLPSQMVKKLVGVDLPPLKSSPSSMVKTADSYEPQRKSFSEFMTEASAAWQRKEGKNPEGGLNKKGIASYRRENPGSKLSMAVTTPPSKLKPGSKSAKRRKSFCARMGGMPGPMKDEKGRPTRKALSLRKWNC
jgi:hypothetical protein